MKKKINLYGLLFFLSFIGLTAQTPHFFYSHGERRYLELDTRYAFVSIAYNNTNMIRAFAANGAMQNPLRADVTESMRLQSGHKRYWTILNFEDGLSDEAYLAKLSEIQNAGQDIITAPFFIGRNQSRLGLSNFFNVMLKLPSDTVLLKQEAERMNASIVYQSPNMPLWYVLSVTEASQYNAMEMANHFHRTGLFRHAVPDLMQDMTFHCVNDHWFREQWGLRNTGQGGAGVAFSGIDIKACEAWQLSTGRDIIVAVFDRGINFNNPHRDLYDNILFDLSWDADTESSPQQLYRRVRIYPDGRRHYTNHGTPVVGIIAAKKNNREGIAGVAPESRIMSISSSGAGIPDANRKRADALNWAWRNGADVINLSWGQDHSLEIALAIDSAVTYGRGGRGTVVVVASGNWGISTVSFPACLPNVMTVGAMNRFGRRNDSSNFGPALDVVAPSEPAEPGTGRGIFTTSWDGGYIRFDGTSAAAPHVAGMLH